MRFARIVALPAVALIPALLGPAVRTQQSVSPIEHRLADVSPGLLRHRVFAAHTNQHKKCFDFEGDLDTASDSWVELKATPIVVNGLMYLPTADSVIALEPERAKSAGGM